MRGTGGLKIWEKNRLFVMINGWAGQEKRESDREEGRKRFFKTEDFQRKKKQCPKERIHGGGEGFCFYVVRGEDGIGWRNG